MLALLAIFNLTTPDETSAKWSGVTKGKEWMEDMRAATHRPDPKDEDSWAHCIRTIEGARVLPSLGRGLIQKCGVYDADGHYCYDAVLWRRRPLMVPVEAPVFAPSEKLYEGTYLWGGVLHNHFGHFLVESLGRVWGYGEGQANINGLLFIEKRADNGTVTENMPIAWHSDVSPLLKNFQKEMFEQLGINVPIGLVRAPVNIEKLVVPGQGFGMGALAAGTPVFRSFVQQRVGRDIDGEGPQRLYLSRSAYGAQRGGVIGEDRIEERLKKDGYTVFHPQKESLTTQIARYKAAKEIIALDGSALHLLAMVATPNQNIAMIKRRSSPISKGIETHLASFTGRPPFVIDAIKRNWLRSDRKRIDRFSLAELDFPAIGKALSDAGVATPHHWINQDDKQRDETLVALSKETRFTFRAEGSRVPNSLPPGIIAACYGIEVPKSHAVGPKWLVRKINNGRYEKDEIAGALHLIGPQDRVLECGAGIGIVGTVVAHNRKPEQILSFEANPHLISVIENIYRHNKVDARISVKHGALMAGKDISNDIRFNVSKRFAFSSIEAPQRELAETVTVPVYDFSQVKADFRPTVLLMDIEGGELGFLEAADLSGIEVVVMEFHPGVYGTEGLERCKALIRQAGLEPVPSKSNATVWAAQSSSRATQALMQVEMK